ncbi:MAG: HU family DNA-binding protein [Candidatus Magasanikbacteria bacterium]
MRINKIELAEKIADEAGTSKKDAKNMLDAFVDVTIDELQKGNEVSVTGFGKFSAKKRAGRMGVNPQNPDEKIEIPEVTVPKFKAGLTLKRALKENE